MTGATVINNSTLSVTNGSSNVFHVTNAGNTTIGGSLLRSSGSVTATGTDLIGAAPLAREFNKVTATGANQGVKLPGATAGSVVTVTNSYSQDIKVYPVASNEQINGLSPGSPVTVAAGEAVTFRAYGTLKWSSFSNSATLANVNITSGTINGTSIGATNASTGKFTTLDSTGNFAVNGNKFTITASTGNTTTAGSVTIHGNTTLGSDSLDRVTLKGVIQGASPLIFEGATSNGYETTLAVAEPTFVDKTITLPNATGTVITTGNLSGITSTGTLTSITTSGNTTLGNDEEVDSVNFNAAISGSGTTAALVFEGSTGGVNNVFDDLETSILIDGPSADRTITIPDASGAILLSDNLAANMTSVNGIAYVTGTSSSDIQTAINTLTSGGTVYLKAGTYSCTATLTFPNDNITLQGAGSDATTLDWGSSILDGIIIDKDGIIIRGMKLTTGSTVNSGNDGIRSDSASKNVTITDCHITGWPNAIKTTSGATNWIIENNTIEIGWTDGVYLGGFTESRIAGNHFTEGTWTSNAGTALELQSSAFNVTITGNTFSTKVLKNFGDYITITGNNFHDGAYIHCERESAWVTISGNTINDSSDAGIRIEGDYSTITGNTIFKGSNGIEIEGFFNTSSFITYPAEHNTISNNSISNCTSVGIYIELYAYNTAVTGNTIRDSASYGIGVRSVRSSIVGNNIHSSYADGIYLLSTGGTVVGNTISNAGEGNSLSSVDGIKASSASANYTITGNFILNPNDKAIEVAGSYTIVDGNIGATIPDPIAFYVNGSNNNLLGDNIDN